MQSIIWICAIAGAYLMGSISSAIVVCTLFGLPDPRTHGSHNPGATNVLRLGGKKAAALTLLGDMLKGFLPVALIHWFIPNPWLVGGVLLAAFIGHLWPIFFNFKGGKGVATALGGIIGMSPLLGSVFIISWLIVFVATRFSSLAALIAITSLPLWGVVIKLSFPSVCVLIVVALIIVWRHRTNIQRLWRGEEPKFGTKQ